MRLIDADALKRHEADTYGAIEDVVYAEDIDNAPTIDAVPVVRCKDCKRCDGFPCPDNIMPNERGFCELDASLVKPDDFCSYGLRKDGDGNG